MTAFDAYQKWHVLLPVEVKNDGLESAFIAGWDAHFNMMVKGAIAVRPVATPDAVAIYAAYPRKVGREGALKAIIAAANKLFRYSDITGPAHERPFACLLEKTKAYAAATSTWKDEDKKFIPHPATWFNRGSYDDDPAEWQRGTIHKSQFSQSH